MEKPWIQTNSGTHITPFNINVKDIRIEDIAHSLSNICRWGGHCRIFYSVASHSLAVSDIAWKLADQLGYDPVVYAFEGLLHDAPEYATGDIPTPIKVNLPDFLELEDSIQAEFATKFNLPRHMSAVVQIADRIALIEEASYILNVKPQWLHQYIIDIENSPLVLRSINHYFGNVIHTIHDRSLTTEKTKQRFLEEFFDLGKGII